MCNGGTNIIEIAPIVISLLSFVIAVFALRTSIKGYRTQIDQYELSKTDLDDKRRSHLQIQKEQFLSSHTLGTNESKYYVDHPDEIGFEYRANYINKGSSLIKFESAYTLMVPENNKNAWINPGEKLLSTQYLSPKEEVVINHVIDSSKICNLRSFVAHGTEEDRFSGILRFEVIVKFSGPDNIQKEHKRILYRMVEGGGDQSTVGYNPGEGQNEHTFVY